MKIFIDIPETKECQHLEKWFKRHKACNLGVLENVGSLMVECRMHKVSLNMSVKEWKRLGVRFIVRGDESPILPPKKVEDVA